MKPLLGTVVIICVLAASGALAENAKSLAEETEPAIEEEDTKPQTRTERCTTCSGGLKLGVKSPNEVLAALQAIPGAEVHSQSSFEGCSSDKGCVGIKIKDGQVLERFGDVDAFKAASDADINKEFSFLGAGGLGTGNEPPFWWMKENSPFKNVPAGGSFEKFSKSSSSSFSTGGGAGNGASFQGSLDLSGNPFLNGDFSKLASGFASGVGQSASVGFGGAAGAPYDQGSKGSNFQSSFESSSYSGSAKNTGEIDLSKNPFLNGDLSNKFGQSGVQGQFQAGSQGSTAFQGTGSSGGSFNKFSGGSTQSGYTGSSPSPFAAYNGGSNVNSIQTGQKSEFDYDQQQQTQSNIDEAFKGTGNVHGHEHSSGDLQQTCAGQGYVCVHKAQCNNGVVNTNGAGILQARTKKQYCNTKTEICCRIEIANLPGAGAGYQGNLGVGSATYSGSGSNQGSGLFATNSGSNAFGSSSSGSNSFGASGSNAFGSGSQGTNAFGSGSRSTNSFGSSGSVGFGAGSTSSFGSSTNIRGTSGYGASGTQSGGNFGASGTQSNGNFGASGTQSNSNFGASGTQSNGNFGASGTQSSGNFGASGTQSSGNFGGSGTQSTGNFGASGTFGQGSKAVNSFGSSSSTFESKGTFGSTGFSANGNFGASGSNFGSTSAPASFGATGSANRFASTGNTLIHIPPSENDVLVHGTKNTQTNFIETDSFSAGSESGGVFRPGASGSGLKPGIPYLPPSSSNTVSSTVLPPTPLYIPSPSTPRPYTTPRPVYTTARPTYLPPSTAAPGYLPPVGEQSVNTETRVPPNRLPVDTEGGILLDENRFPRPKNPSPPAPIEIPSGCAAALKCTPIEYCTAEGVISNSTVVLTRDQEAYRVPLTDCKDLESGRIGKCCRDPTYTDPWPTNQLGKWVPGVFGGNDGKYSPDSRGSFNNPRPSITGRPPITGSTILNNFRNPQPTPVTPGYPGSSTVVTQGSYGIGQKGQFEQRGQGQYTQTGIGQFGQAGAGQVTQKGQTQYVQQQGQGQVSQKGQGQFVQQGQGSYLEGGGGQYSQGGVGQFAVGGQGKVEIQEQDSQSQYTQINGQRGVGQAVIQGQGQGVIQGQGQGVIRGQGQGVIQGQGQAVTQGFGTGIREGGGISINQGAGFGVENEYSGSTLYRVFLQRYSAGGQCGLLNGQRPYGNRNELEVDFAEIPWQAMVLLQTNRSLLCGGVITRPDVVITSAACVEGLEAKNVMIKGGEWKLGIDEEPLPFQIVQVKHILRHPSYQHGSYHNDVAVLVLAENLRWAKNIYPICVPDARETLDAYYNGAGECIVTGWGKQVLQAHLAGSIMHGVNVSLINPGECQAKLSQDYPHLLEQYDQNSCACGQPTNPINNICKVDIGSALACTTGDGRYVLRGVYSWDSGCQPGNQLAAFYKFDVEWYEWALGLSEGSGRFAQFGGGSQVTQNRYSSQINSGVKGGHFAGGVKGSQISGVKGQGQFGGQFSGQFGQFGSSKFSESHSNEAAGVNFGAQIKSPIQNTFSATYSEKKVFQSEPKYVTFTTKPEIVTFTTKPEYFTYTTKPKLVTYTTKPQIVTYETSGSGQNPQYVAPGVTYNPGFSAVVGAHRHDAECKCNGKK